MDWYECRVSLSEFAIACRLHGPISRHLPADIRERFSWSKSNLVSEGGLAQNPTGTCFPGHQPKLKEAIRSRTTPLMDKIPS